METKLSALALTALTLGTTGCSTFLEKAILGPDKAGLAAAKFNPDHYVTQSTPTGFILTLSEAGRQDLNRRKNLTRRIDQRRDVVRTFGKAMDVPLATGAGVAAAVFIPVQYAAESALYLGTAGKINPFNNEERHNSIFSEYGPQTTPRR
ncbi:MAG: hypothetical protein QGG55_10645 [Verrucomicrobiota bacterium]|jgi:hypothetical protein|nr:hypothetical protein [Verrucomicrobiota bacterium]